jgi:hypothetical protein
MSGSGALAQIAAIFTAIIGLAMLAVLLSRNSNTPAVIGAAFGGLATSIGAAVSPITGSTGGMGGLSPSF